MIKIMLSLFVLSLQSIIPPPPITVGLTPSSLTVRSGESFEIFAYFSNNPGYDLSGYQLGFGWDTDSFEMTAEPYTESFDVLKDIWACNAPPFSSGWSSAPAAGDGVGRDYIFALGASFVSTNVSAASLFQTPFVARQATSHNPISFTIDEFSNDIGQVTIVSDSAANVIPLVFMDCEIEVTPNISSSGSYALGTPVTFELFDEAGHQYKIGVSLSSANQSLGNFGTIFLDRNHPTFSLVATGITNGQAISENVLIPNIPSLSGQTVYAQALVGSGADARLSNGISFTLL
jgi:hypothetical protein